MINKCVMTIDEKKRARLSPAPGAMDYILGPDDPSNLMQPLRRTRGLVFPFTPDVQFSRVANYSDYHFTHSNYKFHQFQNSSPGEIQITGEMAVQTNEEGRYLIAALRFLQASTMLEFGLNTPQVVRGTPPPVLRFNYMGAHIFNNVPVVVSVINFNFDRGTDYVKVTLPGGPSGATPNSRNTDFRSILSSLAPAGFGNRASTTPYPGIDEQTTYVPTKMIMFATLLVQPNPRDLRDNFNLGDFKKGALLGKGYL